MMQRLDGSIFGLEQFGINPLNIDLCAVCNPAMEQRLTQRFVGILKRCVFSDDRNRHLTVRAGNPVAYTLPGGQVRRFVFKAKMPDNLAVQPLFVIGQRNLIDIVHIQPQNHGRFPNVAE